MAIDFTKPLEMNQKGYRSVEYVGPTPGAEDTQVTIRCEERESGLRNYTFFKDSGIMVGYERSDNGPRVRNASETEISEKFNVLCGKEEWEKTNWQQLPIDRYEFSDAKEASKKMKELNATSKEEGSDWRFILKKRIENASATNWQEWMQDRFDREEWKLPVWKDEPWANKYPEHFAHNSIENFESVAFIESDGRGLMDQVTVMGAGRYLNSYFSDVLSQDEIATWTAKFDTESELIFGDTPEFFANSYMNAHLGSCMGYKKSHFGSRLKHHPTEVYAAGDLALCLLKRRDTIVSRCIVIPALKRYIRIYGDSRRMLAKLTAEGYRPARNRHLEGLRLQRIECDLEDSPAVYMPYLDLSMHARPHPTDQSLLLMARRGNIPGNGHRFGRAHIGAEVNSVNCGACSTVVRNPQDAPFVGGGQNRIWCQSCADNRARRCDYTGEYFYENDSGFVPVPVLDPVTRLETGKKICPAYADDYEDEVQMVSGRFYVTQGLVFNTTTKVWSLPPKQAETETRKVA